MSAGQRTRRVLVAVAILLTVSVPSAAAATWSTQTVPVPPGGPYGQLLGVACPSMRNCTAVGTDASGDGGLAEHYNGSTWTITPTPAPASGVKVTLSGVSCQGPLSCEAVGASQPSSPQSAALAEQWNGTAWRAQSLPATGDRTSLNGISCVTAQCIAVGEEVPNGTETPQAFAERWDGTAWSLLPTPKPSGIVLNAVSCTGPHACTAVGSAPYDGITITIAERWNGVAWTIEAPPDALTGFRADNSLSSVSCSTATDCVAVGSAIEGDSTQFATILAHWNGNSWSQQSLPSGLSGAGLNAVSCTSPSFCLAFGAQEVESSSSSLVLRYDGTAWSTVSSPGPPPGSFGIQAEGVSCTSPSACIGVGTLLGPNLVTALDWNGAEATLQGVPTPFSAGVSGFFNSVSCSSVSACTAVGIGSSTERFDGSHWIAQPTPQGTGGELFGVSCPATSACLAVGEDGQARPLLERWDGTTWVQLPSPSITGFAGGLLTSISCVSSTSCLAVGIAQDSTSGGADATLAERYDGTSWSVSATPTPAGAGYPLLAAVSCLAATNCIAVGADEVNGTTIAERFTANGWTALTPVDRTGALTGVACNLANTCLAVGQDGSGSAVAERWNGTDWRAAAPPPEPVRAVACARPNRCTAVGTQLSVAADTSTTDAAEWNGTGWTTDTTQNPDPALNQFDSVACPSQTSCTAVGETGQQPLAEVSSNPLG